MSATPFQLPDPIADAPAPPPSPSPVATAREATARALIVGSLIGVVMAAANVYTSLKTSFIDGGSITAALLGFTLFATFKGLARRPYSALENNITQTTAASAAIMAFVLGVYGPMPAMTLIGQHVPSWAMLSWGMALGLLGIFVAASLRAKLIVAEALPFPTGAATAEIIETIHAGRETALNRTRLLLFSALTAAIITWFRDGHPSFIPAVTALPLTVAGLSAASLTLGISWSPMMASIGIFMGFRVAASMFVGAVLTWGFLAPALVRAGIVSGSSYGTYVAWLVWPGLGLMAASTMLPLVLGWRSVGRSLMDVPAMILQKASPQSAAGPARFPLQRSIVTACVVVVIGVGWLAFDLHPAVSILALLLAVILAGVCGRAAGETDLAPIGSVGMVTQLIFAGSGVSVSLLSGAIAAAESSQTSQTLWALKAGHRLKASPNAQIAAQILGAAVGALVVVPVYLVLVKTYGVGTEALPAPAAMSWKATAEAVRGGLAAMPAYGPAAGAIGIGLGVVLCLLGRTRVARFLPSPMALGIAALTPASLSVA
ncbi:MAG TPA: OPT/YSL family transporter, partial [Polyangia bacterium]|nr:OPT/YSL family transporter [Polyangia bacterium]